MKTKISDVQEQSFLNRLLHATLRTLKSIVLTVIIGIFLSFLIHIFADKAFDTVTKFMGMAFAFIGLASHIGSDGINRDYNYNMAKISNPSLAKHENDLRTGGGSSNFMLVTSIAGGLLFVLGYMLEMGTFFN